MPKIHNTPPMITLNRPEPTVTMELSLRDANIVRALLGVSGGDASSGLYSELHGLLAAAGVDFDDVGDLHVPDGSRKPYRYRG